MPLDIRALRQEYADRENEINENKRMARAILNNPTGEGGRLTVAQDEQASVLEAAILANEDALTVVGEQMRRWEVFQEIERDAPTLRVGGTPTPDLPSSAVTETPHLYHSLGEQLFAIYQQATGQKVDERLQQLNNFSAAAFGAGEQIGSEGGFLVQSDFSSEIFRVMHEVGVLLSAVRRTPVTGNGLKMAAIDETSRVTGSRWGGVRGYWVDEGEAPTATQAKFAKLELTLHKIAALGYATDELLADAGAMTMIFTQAFAEELSWLVEDAIFNGSGAAQPLGILNSNALVTQDKEVGQAANSVQVTNLSKMWARLHVRSRMNSNWYINQDLEPALDELFILAGTGALEPRIVTYSPEGVLRIKGRPVVPLEYCKTLGTVGDIILMDPSQYMMIDKNGIRQDTSIHVRFATDEMAFRALYRVDGQPLWKSALTPANGTNTVSPFVALENRS